MVGQIRYEAQGATHTVVLGPFSARGILDSPEKFQRATEAGSAARTAGQGLAWDAKTGLGRGRFMLAPAFASARDAYDFFRGNERGEEIKALTSKMLIEGGWREARGAAELKADLDAWAAGRWAQEAGVGPNCNCGLPAGVTCRFCRAEYERHCPRHDRTAKPHRCRRAA
ncbi:hypothetical protein DVK44_29655 [Streptomyces paludis]|uniref:Uncharacterized protein n=1 Tax=Streptomyces paludis TaxID=2282738 RepID=A0A345HWU5_9ACTN|nr:hypothetical protein DVK44_29655 [Streptomyces paludis]